MQPKVCAHRGIANIMVPMVASNSLEQVHLLLLKWLFKLLCHYIQLKLNAKQKEFSVLRFIMSSCTSEIEISPVCNEYYCLCVCIGSHNLHRG